MSDSTSEQPAGRRLGRYIVRRKIGAGGFARVYLGWDPDLEIEVAIKVPKPQLADDEGALERFRREATTAAKLRHPNVVTVLTVGRLEEDFDGAPPETPYLVMDFLPESLAGRLTDTPVLPEADWLRIGTEVGRALAYAHARGVVHRDVKPDNILFGRHGEAVVTDFGIARAVAEGAAPQSRSVVVGTPEYFSPEQARGLPLDGRTDIYALGVTLYRAATGTLPFTGTDWYAIMRQHVEDAPPEPQAINPALSERSANLLLACLAKSPDDRYQTADELLADLESARRAASGQGAGESATVDLPRAVVRYRTPRPPIVVPRRRPASALAVVAVPLVVATAGATWWLTRRVDAVPGVAAADAKPATPRGDSLATTPVTPAPVDSAARPLGDTAPPRAVAQRASLSVIAPTGAVLVVNNQSVGAAPWRVDSLTPGRYVVQASVPSPAGCPTATATSTVDVGAGRRERVRLTPVACGLLWLDSRTPGARYAVTDQTSGAAQSEGPLPLSQPLVLPAGTYRVTISKSFCAPYNDTVVVAPGALAPRRTPIPLICER